MANLKAAYDKPLTFLDTLGRQLAFYLAMFRLGHLDGSGDGRKHEIGIA